MNFDNLVEDAEKSGLSWYVSTQYEEQIKALITQYILADRAASGEPFGYVPAYSRVLATFVEMTFEKQKDDDIPLFTHAQPTPSQIAEIQAQALEKASSLLDMADKLRKGEIL